MKVRSLVTGFDLTEGKEYEVIFEYDEDLMSWVDARTGELVSTSDIASYGG